MPLLFFLAGCSTYFALRKRSGGEFAWERVKRLLVPLVFGILILIPPQTWYGARFNSGYGASYWHYLVSGDFMGWNIQDGGDYFGGFGIGQLWFIMFLLFISLIATPFVLWGAKGRGIRRMQAFCRLSGPACLVAPADRHPLRGDKRAGDPGRKLHLLSLRIPARVCRGVRSQVSWSLPSVTGFRRWWEGARWRSSGCSRRASGTRFRTRHCSGPVWPSWAWLPPGWSWWGCWDGKRHLDRTSRSQKYLAQGSYPVYILHQTVIVVVGFYVVRMAVPEPLQWLLLFGRQCSALSPSTRSFAGSACCASSWGCVRSRGRPAWSRRQEG